MSYVENPVMLRRGYVRSVEVAQVLGKSLTTVHRWYLDGLVKGARDGRALYVLVDSLVEMFKTEGNEPMADVARTLKRPTRAAATG